MVNAISFPSHKSCLRWGSNTHLSYFREAPRSWFRTLSPAHPSLISLGPERYPPFSHRLPNLRPCRASAPGLGSGLLPGRFLRPVVSEPHAKPVTWAVTEPKPSLRVGVASFLPLASCCHIPVARTIAPTHLQLQPPQNYATAGAFHFIFGVSLYRLSFKPCVTSYGAKLRKIETISAIVPSRKSTVQIVTYEKFNCISLLSLLWCGTESLQHLHTRLKRSR